MTAIYLLLLFGLPMLYYPPWGLGGDATFQLPRMLALTFAAPLTPWQAGWWTPLEWLLLWTLGVQVLLHPDGATGFASLIFLAGLLLVRAGRGLPQHWAALVRRWWPLALGGPLLLWWVQLFVPTFDIWPHAPWLARPSTYGNPIFVGEALLPLLTVHPLVAAGTMLTVATTTARGAFAAGVGALLLHRRWLLAGLCALPMAGALLVSKPSLATLEVRAEIWRRVTTVVRQHPFLGVGTGRLSFAVPQGGVPHETQGIIRHAHNDYLERLAEWGLPGGLLFAVWIAWLASRDLGLTAVALAALVQFPLANPASWAMFCFLGGLATRNRTSEPVPLRRRFLEG